MKDGVSSEAKKGRWLWNISSNSANTQLGKGDDDDDDDDDNNLTTRCSPHKRQKDRMLTRKRER
jgi:hypothetical protein